MVREQSGGRLDTLEVGQWYVGEIGALNSIWSCPEAPVKSDGWSTFPLLYSGQIDRAWQTIDWYWGWEPRHPASQGQKRGSSYALNSWLFAEATWQVYPPSDLSINPFNPYWKPAFVSESQVTQPMWTPVVADSVYPFIIPMATDGPATDLINGSSRSLSGCMPFMNVPRHGNRPSPVPTHWPTTQPLPGAINVSFYDGHGETAKLDRLWQFYWHAGYQPPVKRPGLP
jgi:prepilin-type processing-associated H-X9-DG protein